MISSMLDWEVRKDLLIKFQDAVCSAFDPKVFNIFVFGSYLTTAFGLDSDIDLAIYAEDDSLSFEILYWTKDFFEDYDIPVHMIFLRHDALGAYIDLVPLETNVTITEYYPMKLKEYFCQLLIKKRREDEQRDSIVRRVTDIVEANNLDRDYIRFSKTI